MTDSDIAKIEQWAGMPIALLYREFEIIKEVNDGKKSDEANRNVLPL